MTEQERIKNEQELSLSKQVIADLRRQLAEAQKISNEVIEAIQLLRELRLIYQLTPHVNVEPQKTYLQYTMKQCEEAIKDAHSRRNDEYIQKIGKQLAACQKELAEASQAKENALLACEKLGERMAEKDEHILNLVRNFSDARKELAEAKKEIERLTPKGWKYRCLSCGEFTDDKEHHKNSCQATGTPHFQENP